MKPEEKPEISEQVNTMLKSVREELAIIVKPDIQRWIDKCQELLMRGYAVVQPDYVDLSKEIELTVASEHTVVLGSIFSATRLPESLSAALGAYSEAVSKLMIEVRRVEDGQG